MTPVHPFAVDPFAASHLDLAAVAAAAASYGPAASAAPATAPSGRGRDFDEAVSVARAAERARLGAILLSAEGAAQPQLAAHLALKTDEPAEVCLGILRTVPPGASAGGLAAARLTAEESRAGWTKAVAAANATLAADPAAASAPSASAAGWGKAVAAANASIGVR